MTAHPRPVTLAVLGAGRVGRAVTQRSPVRVLAVEHVRDQLVASVLVICVRARFDNPGAHRGTGLLPNARLVAGLATQLDGFAGTVVMVTNPVDVMSRLFAEHSAAAVYGVGPNLDSARYRTLVAEHLDVPVAAVDGSVLGEHGEDAIICAHATRVHHRPVRLPLPRLRAQLQHRSPCIAAGLDRTQHGPAGAVLATVHKLLGRADGHEELSVAAANGVYLGHRLRFVAGRSWIDQPDLSPSEQAALEATGRKLAILYDHARWHLPARQRAPLPLPEGNPR